MVLHRAFRARHLTHEMQHLTSTGRTTLRGWARRYVVAPDARKVRDEASPVMVIVADSGLSLTLAVRSLFVSYCSGWLIVSIYIFSGGCFSADAGQ